MRLIIREIPIPSDLALADVSLWRQIDHNIRHDEEMARLDRLEAHLVHADEIIRVLRKALGYPEGEPDD